MIVNIMPEYNIPEKFVEYAEATILRLQILCPEIQCSLIDGKIVYQTTEFWNCEKIVQQISHTLYREKIYHETLPVRKMVVEQLMK